VGLAPYMTVETLVYRTTKCLVWNGPMSPAPTTSHLTQKPKARFVSGPS
jgi:hypothetical protein